MVVALWRRCNRRRASVGVQTLRRGTSCILRYRLTVCHLLRDSALRLALGRGYHPELMAAWFPVLVFIPGTIVAAIEPRYATYFWLLAFFGLVVRRLLSPRDEA